jgi:GMP synthase (glutamine-hydrolysing)
VAFEDLGNLADVLHQNDFKVAYTEAGLDDLRQLDPLEPELLIVLGGPIGAYEEEAYPFLLDELRLLERRLVADLPTIGICLGAQLMARALGAKVYPGPAKELGWGPLQISEEGWRSPMQHLSEDRTAAVLHWHGDTFDMPQGAIHLAATPLDVNQAFAWGKRGLAIQFHAEVTAPGLERWLIGHAGEIGTTPGVSALQLRQDTRRYAAALQGPAMTFWQAWLDAALMPHHVNTFQAASTDGPSR